MTMLFRDMPIQRKLQRIIFIIISVVLLVTSIGFFIFEFYAFRKTTIEKLSTIGEIIAANSTAAIAFDSPEDAKEILAALKTEPHIRGAAIYDKNGKIFAKFVNGSLIDSFPGQPGPAGYILSSSLLEGFEPVALDDRRLGSLYLQSDLGAMYERLQLYAFIVVLVVSLAYLLAYLLSRALQKTVTRPILALAETAESISHENDYSVRASKTGNDEVGLLTDAFNNMLNQIEEQSGALQEQQRQEQIKIITTTLDAQEKERNLIGQELHDNVNQILVGTKLFLSMLRQDPVKNKSLIMASMESIQQAIAENRKIAHALVAPDFETKILSVQIADLFEGVLKTSGIETQFRMKDFNENHLTEDQKLAAYRIAQEQCANIVKHAQAKKVIISLSTLSDRFEMLIADDGLGADIREASGIGLKNIRSRMSIFNGTVTVRTSPGNGFTLVISMPLQKNRQEAAIPGTHR